MAAGLNLARKYRPGSLKEVVGQDRVVKLLSEAISTDRIAPAYLFSGPRGTGKTTCARIFAKAASCKDKNSAKRPCEKCDYCVAVAAGKSMDLLEIDGASHTGVDDVRSIIESVAYRPTLAARNVYIIDEVHMLSNAAFNALLKTLEEPPPHVLFLFATTEPEKIPETILSRVQRLELHRIKEKEIVGNLDKICKNEKIKASPSSLQQIAAASDGCLRDAQTLLEQNVLLSGSKNMDDEVVDSFLGTVGIEQEIQILELLSKQSLNQLLEKISIFFQQGKDLNRLLSRIVHWVRAIMLVKATNQTDFVQDEFSKEHLERLLTSFKTWSVEDMDRLFEVLWAGMERIKKSELPKITLETTIVRSCRLSKTLELAKVIQLLEQNSNLSAATPVGPTPSARSFAPPPVPPRASTVNAMAPKKTAKKAPPPMPPREASEEAAPIQLKDKDSFLQIVRKKKASLHGLVVCSQNIQVTANKVEIVFTKGHFAYKQLSQKVLLDELSALLSAETGKKVSIDLIEGDKVEERQTPSSSNTMKSVKKAMISDPEIQRAAELLGAEISSVTIEGVKN